MAALPAGGGLTEALANNITSTNAAQAALPGQIIDSELNRAFSLATGAPLQASTSLASNAAGLQANAANQAAANSSAAKQGIGVGAGSYLATKAQKAASSRDWKNVSGEVDADKALAAVEQLPVVRYTYNEKAPVAPEGEHIGTFAEDFNLAMFGSPDRTIALQDYIGLLHAGMKAMARRIDVLEGR